MRLMFRKCSYATVYRGRSDTEQKSKRIVTVRISRFDLRLLSIKELKKIKYLVRKPQNRYFINGLGSSASDIQVSSITSLICVSKILHFIFDNILCFVVFVLRIQLGCNGHKGRGVPSEYSLPEPWSPVSRSLRLLSLQCPRSDRYTWECIVLRDTQEGEDFVSTGAVGPGKERKTERSKITWL